MDRKILLFSVLLLCFLSVCFTVCSEPQQLQRTTQLGIGRRRMLLKLEAEEEEQEFEQPLKKKSTKNQTQTIKSNSLSSKNQTKLEKRGSNSKTIESGIKKLNSTALKIKKLNSTSKASNSTSIKKSLDLAKNKTTKATATKDKETEYSKKQSKETEYAEKPKKQSKETEYSEKAKKQSKETEYSESEKSKKQSNKKTEKKQAPPSWLLEEEESDLVSEFKDLPVRFQQTLIPDLERISTTSKAYITKANKEITKGFKPYVGNKYAPAIATLLCFAFVLIPLLLASLVFNKIKAYFSLQKLLIFIQTYLSIYFSILCFSSFVTGLEPLKFFYATSQSTYVCLQVLQTLAYFLYLLLLLMYLVLVFSTDCGLGSKFLGLAQTFVGFAVGLHYYMTVFHRVVLRQPPKTNWKIHGIYATCFFLICLVARADRRKKSYLEESGEEGKKN